MSRDLSNWCPEYYRGLFIDRHNADRAKIAPCCQATGEIVDNDKFNYESNSFLTRLRQTEKPVECARCWTDEYHGVKSKRQSVIEFYNLTPSDEIKLQSLDIAATWACNCACIMCGPEQSSLWAKELNTKSVTVNKQNLRGNQILKNVDLSGLQKVHFNGGEPLLTNDHLEILERTPQSSLFASYNTNGTIYPNKQTIKMWEKLKLVRLFFSIDAIGGAYEYIRWPAVWEQVEKNILKLRANMPSNVMFGVNVTVGIYNILELPSLVDWFRQSISTNREGDASDFNWQIAYNFDPLVSSLALRAELKKAISGYDELVGVNNYLTEARIKELNWAGQLNQIDRRRGTSWQNSLKIGKYF